MSALDINEKCSCGARSALSKADGTPLTLLLAADHWRQQHQHEPLGDE